MTVTEIYEYAQLHFARLFVDLMILSFKISVMWGLLRILDLFAAKLKKGLIYEAYQLFKTSPLAMSIYLGARYIAVGLLCAFGV